MEKGYAYSVILAMVLLSLCGPAKGQGSSTNTSCINGIIQCGNYLTTTGTPPTSCCNPLKNVINTEIECLCQLLNNTSLLQQFQINITQVEQLPIRCGLNATASSCLNGSALSPSAGSALSPSAGSAPPPSIGKDSNSALSSSFGILPLLALLLLGVVTQIN